MISQALLKEEELDGNFDYVKVSKLGSYFSNDYVYNIHTDKEQFIVKDDSGNNIVVHNCMCMPDYDRSSKRSSSKLASQASKLSQLHEICNSLSLHFDSLHTVADVATELKLEKAAHEVAAAIFGKDIYISNWVNTPDLVYISMLAELYIKKHNIKEIVPKSAITFPFFKEKQLVVLQRSGIFDFDGTHYCFTPAFISAEYASTDSQLLDDLLHARQYIVRWNIHGDPVYNDTNLYESPDELEHTFVQTFVAFFMDNEGLRQANQLAWTWILEKLGKIVKWK